MIDCDCDCDRSNHLNSNVFNCKYRFHLQVLFGTKRGHGIVNCVEP